MGKICAKYTSLRALSCFICDTSKKCEHGKHLGFLKNHIETEKENVSPYIFNESDVVPLLATKKRIQIISDITINKHNIKDLIIRPSTSKK